MKTTFRITSRESPKENPLLVWAFFAETASISYWFGAGVLVVTLVKSNFFPMPILAARALLTGGKS